ncbi:carbonyl reductase [Pleomassaria siparia CBS 279.74]|uniref:Carbonyl reductase n=1 Tax=Pleomassaria siparia CBS 279.74 TaxID=1314801 RepID=A0A6G1KMP8_9PLEO|nr:carbonyl reductase [Pleomassaria siparia CBS 279.74]
MHVSKEIALVTGANRGIGFELARTLARDHSFHVLLGARNSTSGASSVATLQGEGLSVELLVLDLSSDGSIISAAKKVEEKYGRLDVLVNNAGIYLGVTMPPVSSLRSLFHTTFDTNLFGSTIVTEAFVPLLCKAPLPRIIFVSSALGSITHRVDPSGAWKDSPAFSYRCTKAALNMVCASYAKKYREKGWKVNSACPGSVKTEMTYMRGVIEKEEAMPNLVRLCTLGEDGETGTFSDANGAVPW